MTDTKLLFAHHNKRVVAILGLLFLSSALCSLPLIWVALTSAPHNLGSSLCIGAMGLWGVVMFGWWGLWYLAVLFGRNPALVASRDGLYDNSEPWSLGLVKWSEVKSVHTRGVGFWWVVTLVVYNHDAIVKRQQSVLKRLLYKLKLFRSDTEIGIRLNTMTEPMLGELLERVEDARKSRL